MKKYKILHNPYLLFSPFLLLLIIYVLIFPTNGHQGDEGRYLEFAHNLLHGFYSPPAPNINLTNGPGYPVILTPFLAFGFPLITLTIMNAFFYYFSIIFLYKALKQIVSFKVTIIFSFFWAFYYIAYQNIPFIHTETFTYFLISILILATIESFKANNQPRKKRFIVLAGFTLGYIVLTKIAFVYVFLAMLLASIILFITNRKSSNYQKGVVIMLISFATLLPYMIYTFKLTGRLLYWNTNTGVSLYWSTSPYPGEYGDWKENLKENPIDMGNFNIPGAGDSLVAHHQNDYDKVFKKHGFSQAGMLQDDEFKLMAINNIKSHPLKYLQNCFYNVGRLVFHYPFSYAVQRPKVLIVFPLNGIVLTFILFSLIPTIKNWRNVDFPIRVLLIFTFLYLGLSAMVTAYVRMFTIIVPILMLWFAYTFQNTMKISLKFTKKEL